MSDGSGWSGAAWLSVEIRPGLFPTERTVQFQGADGEDIAVFVSSRQVDEGEGALKVTLLDQDGEFALIHVPSQSGSTVAKVARHELRQV